jgi:hypothetical protein
MNISSPEKLLIANRRRRVVELRRDGMSLEVIADTIRSEFESPNYCKQRSHDDLVAALSGANKLTADEVNVYRRIEELRLDFMWERLVPGIEAACVKSIEAGIKLCHRKSKLMGIDAVNQAIVEDTVQKELNSALDQLQNNLSPQHYQKVLEVLSGRTDILKLGDLEEDD